MCCCYRLLSPLFSLLLNIQNTLELWNQTRPQFLLPSTELSELWALLSDTPSPSLSTWPWDTSWFVASFLSHGGCHSYVSLNCHTICLRVSRCFCFYHQQRCCGVLLLWDVLFTVPLLIQGLLQLFSLSYVVFGQCLLNAVFSSDASEIFNKFKLIGKKRTPVSNHFLCKSKLKPWAE